MSFKLEFSTSNAAFDEDDLSGEVARILRVASLEAEDGYRERRIYDANGNTVGEWKLIAD